MIPVVTSVASNHGRAIVLLAARRANPNLVAMVVLNAIKNGELHVVERHFADKLCTFEVVIKIYGQLVIIEKYLFFYYFVSS